MKTIGIIYSALEIEKLLESQTAQQQHNKGTLVGLGFSPVIDSGATINLDVHQIYYKPLNTPTSSLGGLGSDYYGTFSNKTTPSHILELLEALSSDSFLAQSPLAESDSKGLEYSNDTNLPGFGFSFFLKEELLSHISERNTYYCFWN